MESFCDLLSSQILIEDGLWNDRYADAVLMSPSRNHPTCTEVIEDTFSDCGVSDSQVVRAVVQVENDVVLSKLFDDGITDSQVVRSAEHTEDSMNLEQLWDTDITNSQLVHSVSAIKDSQDLNAVPRSAQQDRFVFLFLGIFWIFWL